MKTLFAPGCALKKYKPELIDRMTRFLQERGLIDGLWDPCCKSGEHVPEGIRPRNRLRRCAFLRIIDNTGNVFS